MIKINKYMEYFVVSRELEKNGFYNDERQVVFEFIGNNWEEIPDLDKFEDFVSNPNYYEKIYISFVMLSFFLLIC